MNEIYLQLISYINGMWRRRWYAAALAWVICGAGWTAVASLPDRFESSSRIYVDMDTMLGPLMRGIAVEMNLFQQIDIMRRTLLSRPNLEKIILMTDLDLTVRNEKEKDALITDLGQKISVTQQGRTPNLFRISFEDTDRSLTKRVVQAVMQIFVEGNLGASRKDMETTRRFLDGQIRDYERQLIAAEARLANFKRDNMGLLPGDQGGYYARMRAIQGELSNTEAQIGEAEMIREELRAQIKEVPQFLEVVDSNSAPVTLPGGLTRGPESDINIRILGLQQIIDTLLIRYTPNHPDVLSAQRQMEALQKELAAEQLGENQESNAAAAFDAATEKGKKLVSNPVYEQIKLQLVQQEGVLAALKNRAVQQRAGVQKWTGMAKLVPEVEAQLSQLNRDYEIVKKGYEQLRERQESAKLANELETKAQKVQFRVIDPPKQPIKPSGPNRPILFAAVLIAGLVAGMAFAFLLSQINTTFSTVQRLRSAFTLPVLGHISAVISVGERRQQGRELMGFATVCLCLIIAFGGLVGIELLGTARVLGKFAQLGII